MDNGLTVADALALQDRRSDDGMMGGNGMWMMMFLFFLLAAGGNGFGGFGGRNGEVNMINNDFLYTNLNNTLDRGFTQLSNQNFGIQKDLCQGFSCVQTSLSNLQHNQDMCCCTTNRNIDAVRYENAKNTCDIITAGNANTQRIIDLINMNTTQNLRDQLAQEQRANFANTLVSSNQAQTQNIVNQIRPMPVPAYITCSPYTSPCGNFNGCGC